MRVSKDAGVAWVKMDSPFDSALITQGVSEGGSTVQTEGHTAQGGACGVVSTGWPSWGAAHCQ